MRHNDPSLTAKVCTDPGLLDVTGAVASLPELPLGAAGGPVRPPVRSESLRSRTDRAIVRTVEE